MAASIVVSTKRVAVGSKAFEARRLEELSLNASGAFQSLIYDGWLLGYRSGPTKRLRCVNAFYSTSLPLAEKVDHCVRFYQSVSLPAIFRMLPFSQPPELDAYLESLGWSKFERTLVLRADARAAARVSVAPDAVDRRVHERRHGPVRRRPRRVEEILEHGLALGGVRHLGIELHARLDLALRVGAEVAHHPIACMP